MPVDKIFRAACEKYGFDAVFLAAWRLMSQEERNKALRPIAESLMQPSTILAHFTKAEGDQSEKQNKTSTQP